MSTFTIFAAGLAALAPFTSAYTTPTGDSPVGNTIYEPGLNSVVPAGKPFTITWDPTTTGNISLLLCKGPSTNCVITRTIADSVNNTGSYVWTPSTDLAPSQPTGYGIELVVEGTGAYQYSTQFGISNAAYHGLSSSSSSISATATASTVSVKNDAVADSTSTATTNSTKAASTSAKNGTAADAVSVASSSVVRGTGVPLSGWSGFANATAIKATGSVTVPSSLRTSTKTGSSSLVNAAATATSSSGSASASATQSGVAVSRFGGAGFGGLAVAAGIAVFAL